MQLQDFEKLIKNGESETVEFKAGFNKEAIETAVAFSNTRGGVIIVGVDNQGNMKGLDINNDRKGGRQTMLYFSLA